MEFPETFKFGTSTEAHKIEGKWSGDGNLKTSKLKLVNLSFEIKFNILNIFLGSGISVWDEFSRCHPKNIADRSNADEACESYYKFEEDVFMVKSINVS